METFAAKNVILASGGAGPVLQADDQRAHLHG
jgi:aspartate oxidase